MAESSIRSFVESKELPVYPASRGNAGPSGVSIVGITIKTDGHVGNVKVVEAPSEEVGALTAAAVKKWVFRPIREGSAGDGALLEIDSKLTFYFSPENGGRVTEPHFAEPSKTAAGSVARVPAKDVLTWLKKNNPVRIDIRKRGQCQPSGSLLCLPSDEIAARLNEIPADRTLAIECYPKMEPLCVAIAGILVDNGYKKVGVLER